MIVFYTSRELSDRLQINLAKWKRWTREFLSPDPLAGQQSGYARQYYLDDAFTVFTAGHLVSDLGYSIHDTRQILKDLQAWRKKRGFSFDATGKRLSGEPMDIRIKSYRVDIWRYPDGSFRYTVRGTIKIDAGMIDRVPVRVETYVEESITTNASSIKMPLPASSVTLYMTRLMSLFCEKLQIVEYSSACQ